MSNSSPFDDKMALGLLRLIARASATIEAAPEASATTAPEGISVEAGPRRETQSAESAGESPSSRLLAHLKKVAGGEAAPVAEPSAAPERPPKVRSVRPNRQRPGARQPACAAPSPSPPTPSTPPSLKVWRRALVLPVERAREDFRQVVGWLEAEVASLAAAAKDAGDRPRPALQAPSLAAPMRPAQGDLRERGVKWIRQSIRRLTARVPDPVRALLEKIAVHFCDTACLVYLMRREVGATDWHLQLFKKELGIKPKAFVLACRLSLALWLLRESPLTVEAVARKVGFETEGALRKRFRLLCGISPSSARSYLRRVRDEHRALGDKLLGWSFWVRHHRGELEIEDFQAALTYLEDRFGLPEQADSAPI